ncbi:MAG: ATP-binding protein [Dehalococcoidia bacterium]
MTGNLAVRAALAAVVGTLVGLLSERLFGTGGSAALLGACIGTVAGGVTAYLVMRSTHRAIETLGDAAGRLSEGEFEERVPVHSGPAAGLSSQFNVMASRLEGAFHAVAQEHARLEAVFDASTDAMVALDADSAVRFMNRAAASLFEASSSRALGRPFIEIVRDYELDGLVRRAGEAGRGAQAALVTFGQTRVPLRAVALPINEGGDWSVLLMLTDLTEFNRVDQMRRDFVSNVSHELRTPLAAISAMVETVESGAVDPGEETEEFMRRIRQQIGRLTLMVNELLDLSRIESGAVNLRPEAVDLNMVLQEAASVLAPRAESTNVTLSVPDGPGPVVEADPASLVRVATNLLDNAIKYSPAGGAVIVETSEHGGLGSFTVRDSGPGIAEQDLPRVFERFYKGDPSRTGAGIGLGLAIVKHIVRNHGGTVTVASKPGEGAAFTVQLPKRFVAARPAIRR